MVIGKTTQLTGKTLAIGLDVRCTGHGHSKTSFRTHGQPVILVIRQSAVSMALCVRQRSQHKPVFCNGTALETQGLKQIAHLKYSAQRSHMEPGWVLASTKFIRLGQPLATLEH